MRSLLASFLLLLAAHARAQTASTNYAPYGELLLLKLDSAPFPHPSRAQGHKYDGKDYPATPHYQDNSVGIFIPKGFHPSGPVDFVVHFHGWRNHVENVLSHYELIQQFAAGGRNAILVVPQGPFDAPDSSGGKLEDENGFKRFLLEVVATLRQRQTLTNDAIGSIILSGHSGGYRVMSAIVAQGGLTDHIQEVWLFDALYAGTEKFTAWFDQNPRARLIDLYTLNGGTKKETENLMANLQQKHTPFLAKKEAEVTPEDLRQNRLIFIFTPLEHDEVLQKHHAFADYLRTSSFPPIAHPSTTK